MGQRHSTATDEISGPRWEYILHRLEKEKFLQSIDPRNFVAQLLNARGLSKDEWEIITSEKTAAHRAHKLMLFLSLRPSMFGALKDILCEAHQPLLKVMEESSDEWLSANENRFRKALQSQHRKLKLLGEWAGPVLKSRGCLNDDEVNEIKNTPEKLTDFLTGTTSKRRWKSFLGFLEEEHSDLLRSIEAAVGREPVDVMTQEIADLNEKLEEAESREAEMKGKIGEMTKEAVRLNEELTASKSRTFVLWDDVTDGPYLSRTSLPVGSGVKAVEVRREVAGKLGVPAASVHLSRQTVHHDGVDLVAVKDDSGEHSFGVGVVEHRWEDVKTLPWLWSPFTEDAEVPHFHGRVLDIRASSAPLRHFDVVNEGTGFFDNRNFYASFPLRDDGTAADLKAAIGRRMKISPSSLLLSRPVCRRDGRPFVEVVSLDLKWEGFSTLDGQTKIDSASSEPEPLRDDVIFPVVPNYRNTICVKRC